MMPRKPAKPTPAAKKTSRAKTIATPPLPSATPDLTTPRPVASELPVVEAAGVEVVSSPPAANDVQTADALVATWGATIEWVDPNKLSDHLRWRDLLGPGSPEEEEELIDSVRDRLGLRLCNVSKN